MRRKTDLDVAVALLKLLDDQLSLMAEAVSEPRGFPLGPGSAYDARVLSNIDHLGVDSLVRRQIPPLDFSNNDPTELYQDYVQQRKALNIFHDQIYEAAFQDLESISLELGNYDLIYDCPVIQSDAERNLIHDYSVLYRAHPSGQRLAMYWVTQHCSNIKESLDRVVQQFLEARVAVLRIEKKIAKGIMLVTDMVTERSIVFIDKAMSETVGNGMFFLCSLIAMDGYSMTTGGGIPIDANSIGGRAILSLYLKHRADIQMFKLPLDSKYQEAVRAIYGFCLRNGVLVHNKTNHNYE